MSKKIDKNYIQKNRNKMNDKDVDKALSNEDQIKEKLSVLGKFKEHVTLLFAMLKDFKNKKYTEVPWQSIAAITFALLYLLNPLDLVPDFIPIVGYLDDASIIGLTLKMVAEDLEAYKLWKEKNHST
ncbi:MAG: DUF1232 domain-containing protein [Flavobacteriaceae bacterium]|nr:DUF1232 domain-containing protein [Flavobacteriaceae bacterium]